LYFILLILIFVPMKVNTKITITKEQLLTIDRAARRIAHIESGMGTFKHKAHKSKKDYNRQEYKKIK
jgi:hypothetical protein